LPLSPPKGAERAPAVASLAEERAWRELRALWQRGWASDDAPAAVAIGRQAFAQACRKAEPAAILDGARKWSAAADAPRFLPALWKWLDAEGWAKPAPVRAKTTSSANRGSRHRDTLPRTNGNKVDLSRLALMQGGYVEDDEGRLYHPEDGKFFGEMLSWRPSL
jgi:hypothetical protein